MKKKRLPHLIDKARHRRGVFYVPLDRKRGIPAELRAGWWPKFREWLWPSMGLKAWGRWVFLKLLRTAENPQKVALGCAFGLLVCFVPVLGTHTPLMLLFCWLFQASFFAAFMVSLVGNPWTFGIIWWFSYELGRHVLGMPKVNIRSMLEGHVSFSALWYNAHTILGKVIWPTFLGGMLIGGIASFVLFFVVRWQFRKWLKRRRRRIAAKRRVLA